MSDKKTIRVVKRVERVTGKPKSKEKTAQTIGRDMVATVSSWVNDFQHKRRIETAEAITSLVQARRQPAES